MNNTYFMKMLLLKIFKELRFVVDFPAGISCNK